MMRQFCADTADKIWRQAALALTQSEDVHRQDSRLGPTRELLHCIFTLKDPRQRWVLSRRPAINPAFAIAEVVWILQGRKDAAFLNHWNPALPKFAGTGTTYHGAYGHRLRHILGFDQLQRTYEALLSSPNSRQAVLQIWDGRYDHPNADGTAQDPDIPCNVVAMPKIRAGRLEWLQVMRSNDIFLGTPHNFVQFTVLQEVMAGWLGLEPGAYVQVSDSLHLYEKDLTTVTIAEPSREVRNPDSLALPKDDFDRMLKGMGAAMDRLRSETLTRNSLRQMALDADLPGPWQQMFAIAAADVARRRDWRVEMEVAVDACENPMLREAWSAWEERRPLL